MEKKKVNKVWLKRFILLAVVLLCLDAVFIFGYWSGQKGNVSALIPSQISKLNVGKSSDVIFATFWEAWNLLKAKSVQDIDDQKMVDGAINGMLSSTNDPFTFYLTKEENNRFREDIGGEFSGIGIEIIEKNGVPVVVAPLSGTPAEKAGFKPNDIIVEVDDTKTSDLGFNDTINKIRGTEGTKVTLKVLRDGSADPITIEVVRAKITVKSVEWSMKNVDGKKVEYIKIRQFGDDTDALFETAAKDVIKNNPEGIILDLRNDPGGYLETAVNISSYFINDGTIVSERGRDGSSQEYHSTGNGKLKNYKVTVLVNGGSASASEIVTGALRDRLSSKVIGEKTFGKGSVQELLNLSDGSAVKITVAKWFTPNGNQINGEGLAPDIAIVDDEKTVDDEQLIRAEEFIVKGK